MKIAMLSLMAFGTVAILNSLTYQAKALPASCGVCTTETRNGPEGRDIYQKCCNKDGKCSWFTSSGPFIHGCDPREALKMDEGTSPL